MKDEEIIKKMQEAISPLIRRTEKIEEKLDDITKNPLSSSGGGNNGNFAEIKAEISDLKTSSQSISAELKNFKETTQTNSDKVDSQLAALSASLQSTSNDILSFKTSTETGLSEISNTLESNSQKITQLESTVSDLTDNVIPEIKKQIGNSSGSSGSAEENWVTLYDMNSSDEDVNLGHPNGLFGGDFVNTKWNPLQFKKFRFLYHQNSIDRTCVIEVFDYEDRNAVRFSIANPNVLTPSSVYNSAITMSFENGSWALWVTTIYKIKLTHNKYPTVEKEDQYYYYKKIEGLPM